MKINIVNLLNTHPYEQPPVVSSNLIIGSIESQTPARIRGFLFFVEFIKNGVLGTIWGLFEIYGDYDTFEWL